MSKCLCLPIALMLLTGLAQAQLPFGSDLGIHIENNPPLPWRVNQVGTQHYIVTNYSNTSLPGALIDFRPPIPPNFNADQFELLSQTCFQAAICTQLSTLCDQTPPLTPFGTATCSYTLRALEKGSGPERFRVRVGENFNVIDPNLSNNFANGELSITLIEQLPLSQWLKAALAFLLCGFGAWAARRTR